MEDYAYFCNINVADGEVEEIRPYIHNRPYSLR